jgi:2-alkenal reductase
MNKRFIFLSIILVMALTLMGCAAAFAPFASMERAVESAQADATATPAAIEQAPVAPIQVQAGSLAEMQSVYESIYQKVNPSVVNIQVSGGGTAANPLAQGGEGSGFVWDADGHIVTNNHVVDDAGSILVNFADGTTLEAELVGADPNSDLAVIRVDAPAGLLQPVEMADSQAVRVGQVAIAIGNPFGLAGTMTQGIVSARARSLPVGQTVGPAGGSYTIPDIIQTDAAINPGNSGGVLVDIEGRVIGVTAAIRSTANANSGIGFVIPSNIVLKVAPALITDGRYEHPRIGISGTTLTFDLANELNLQGQQRGVLVSDVLSGGPAAQAGIRAWQIGQNGQVTETGDIITAIDGQTVRSFEDLTTYLFYNTSVGQQVRLTVLRDGQEQTVPVTLGSRE